LEKVNYPLNTFIVGYVVILVPTKIQEGQAKYRTNLKIEVLKHYSDTSYPRCRVCHVTDLNLLSIDHINEDAKHHKQGEHCPGSLARYLKIRKDWPTDLQVLCHNHNMKKMMIHRRLNVTGVIGHYLSCDYLKMDVFKYYGNKCRGCGEEDLLCLSIDHIEDNGAEHRKEQKIKAGRSTYRWLKKNNYPMGFQLLCFNCNKVKELKRVKIIHR
jgi:hypothetical protein